MFSVAVIASASVAHAGGFSTARFGGERTHAASDQLGTIYYNPAGLAHGHGTRGLVEGLFAYRTASYDRDAGAIHNPGTGTPGYWKNHPAAWPVEVITIGGITYTKAEAIARLGWPDGDKRNTLFRALVCATLNVLIGNDSSCIAETIEAGNLWWATYAGSRVAANSAAWKLGEPLARMLDAYNNGRLCAPARR